MSSDNPIFVRGLSRSGGTLLVTLIDTSSEVAMSYELYPNILEKTQLSGKEIMQVIEKLKPSEGRRFAKAIEGGLGTFLNRLQRGGVTPQDAVRLLNNHVELGMDFRSQKDCFVFMAACAEIKCKRESKPRWGMKCLNNYDDYLLNFPEAKFLNIIRDPRDVLASTFANQMKNRTVKSVAQGWANTHSKFENMVQKSPKVFSTVKYEDLVTNPEEILPPLCKFLGINFGPAMLSHQDKRLTIYKASHLSKDRVASKIDSKSIARWHNELSISEVKQLQSECGDVMKHYGYPLV